MLPNFQILYLKFFASCSHYHDNIDAVFYLTPPAIKYWTVKKNESKNNKKTNKGNMAKTSWARRAAAVIGRYSAWKRVINASELFAQFSPSRERCDADKRAIALGSMFTSRLPYPGVPFALRPNANLTSQAGKKKKPHQLQTQVRLRQSPPRRNAAGCCGPLTFSWGVKC